MNESKFLKFQSALQHQTNKYEILQTANNFIFKLMLPQLPLVQLTQNIPPFHKQHSNIRVVIFGSL